MSTPDPYAPIPDFGNPQPNPYSDGTTPPPPPSPYPVDPYGPSASVPPYGPPASAPPYAPLSSAPPYAPPAVPPQYGAPYPPTGYPPYPTSGYPAYPPVPPGYPTQPVPPGYAPSGYGPPGYPAAGLGYAQFGVEPGTGLPYSEKSKTTAGLLQLLLGVLLAVCGIGRLYSGNTNVGLIQLILSVLGWILLFCNGIGIILLIGVWIWNLVDGIMILTGRPLDGQGRPLRP